MSAVENPTDQDDFSGPRRDRDLPPPRTPATNVQEQTEKVELALRARKLRHLEDQGKLTTRANELTRA
jgi:hypothetical protein